MKLINTTAEPVTLPRVRVPLGAGSIVLRIPGPAQAGTYGRPLADMQTRHAEAVAARKDPPDGADLRALRLALEQAEEWQAFALAWRALRMVDDPAWQIDALDLLDAGKLDRGAYPELQYGAAFLEELHEHLGMSAGAVWAFLGAAGAVGNRPVLTAGQAAEVNKLAATFLQADGTDGSDVGGPPVAASDPVG